MKRLNRRGTRRRKPFFLTTEITEFQLLFLLRALRASVVYTISSEFLCVLSASVVNMIFLVHS